MLYRSTIGAGGFIATLELTPINEVLGFLVGLSTLIYMTVSAIKVVKELRNKLTQIVFNTIKMFNWLKDHGGNYYEKRCGGQKFSKLKISHTKVRISKSHRTWGTQPNLRYVIKGS